MNLHGFEKISSNCDVMIHIYKLLKFEDQLRLAQVSAALKTVFEHFIWTMNYRVLAIYEIDSDYVVTNETNVNRVLLDSDAIQDFLRVYAERVEALSCDSAFDLREFPNLTSLRCNGDFFGIDFIQFVAVNLPFLDNFHAICQRRLDEEARMIGAASVESLLKMQHLKQLRLDYSDSNYYWRLQYQHFLDIIHNPKLEVLKLSFEIEPDGETSCVSSGAKSVSLEELDITVSFDPQRWSHNFSSFLQLFANLSTLTLRIPHDDEVEDETLATISSACGNLEKLTMRLIHFKSIATFEVPPKLTELRIERCYGLTYENLKQILTESRLTKFVSQYTEYEGVFEDYRISPSLQTLAIDTVDMAKLPSAYAGNENLKNLSWHAQRVIRNGPIVVTGVPLTSCHNIETLMLRDCHMALGILRQLKQLRTLTTWLNLPMHWTQVTALLRHPTLQELTIEVTGNKTLHSADSPIEGFQTNVTNLQLHYTDSFAADVEFWLNLFCQNSQMKLTIYRIFMDEEDVWKLISHAKFPASLRTIDIFGFTINCDDLRRNFDNTMEKLQRARYEYGADEEDELTTTYKYGIILCRK